MTEVAPKQATIAEHLDLSERSVREFLAASRINHKAATLAEIRVAYIRHLREVAAGRGASGGVDLATERAMLARAQRLRMEMENDERRGVLIAAEAIEPRMRAAMVGAREILRQEPARLARAVHGLTPEALELELEHAFDAFLVRMSRWAEDETEAKAEPEAEAD